METKDYFALYQNKVYVNHSCSKDWICLSPDAQNPTEEFKVDKDDPMNRGAIGFSYISQEMANTLLKEYWKDKEIEFEFEGRKCRADKCIMELADDKYEFKNFLKNLPDHKGNYGEKLHLCVVDGILRYVDNPVPVFGDKVYVHYLSSKKIKTMGEYIYFRPVIDVETGEYI